jgi:hypothetical protein
MGAPDQGPGDLIFCPWRCQELDGGAPVLVEAQEAMGWVVHMVQMGGVTVRMAMGDEPMPSKVSQQTHIMVNTHLVLRGSHWSIAHWHLGPVSLLGAMLGEGKAQIILWMWGEGQEVSWGEKVVVCNSDVMVSEQMVAGNSLG